MLIYRLTHPIIALPARGTDVITLPVGTLIERDNFSAGSGITDVFLDGKRVSVIGQHLLDGSQLVRSHSE